jgi:S-formylglutathione hydrolase FrmB
VVSAQCAAVLLVFVTVNNQYVFYTSWQDLLGAAPPPGKILATEGRTFQGPSGGGVLSRGRVQTASDGGQLITQTVYGNASGITAQVLVHLPAGYDRTQRKYPVVELISGWRKSPDSWLQNFHVLEAMAAAERRGTLGPVITVIPTLNVAMPRDVECTNVPHGPQAEAWLTTDVRNLVLSQYRALPAARNWGLMGYSSGGYCAAKMLLHRPQWYGAAVSIGGYFDAVQDSTTGDLWGGSQARRDANSPLWLVTHRPVPAADLLIFASKQDNQSYDSTRQFLQAAPPPLRTFRLIVPTGGHNLKALGRALPQLLDWLGSHVSGGDATRGSTHL